MILWLSRSPVFGVAVAATAAAFPKDANPVTVRRSTNLYGAAYDYDDTARTVL